MGDDGETGLNSGELERVSSVRSVYSWLAALLAGVLFAVASRIPETWPSAALGLLVVVLLSWSAQRETCRIGGKPLKMLFCSGLAFHLIAFSWIADTISFFGGFPWVAAWALALLFSAISSMQFVIVGVMFRLLLVGRSGKILNQVPIYGSELFALAWFVGEFFVPRLFPWSIVHVGIRATNFAMLASIVGVAPLSALLLWWGGSLSELFSVKRRKALPKLLWAVRFASLFLLFVGTYQAISLAGEFKDAPLVNLGIVQGNLDAKQKGDIKSFDVNVERYRALSAQAIDEGAAALIWPESVINAWIGEEVTSVRGTKFDPLPVGNRVPIIFGALAYRTPSAELIRARFGEGGELQLRNKKELEKLYSKFNGAFALDSSATIKGRFYKKILMPFGEYLPFEAIFPSLRDISPYSGDFTPGDLSEPLPLNVQSMDGREVEMKVGALICYEDLIPSMSRSGVKRGANILVNLTNDAWYGDTPAPHQHQLLALWRAIETGRYLVCATNTGLTSVVNPWGQTELRLDTFTPKAEVSKVRLLSGVTPYVVWGDLCSWILATTVLVVVSLRTAHQKLG
mgnify:CR=1 FL=1